jgi:hypothetical protein
VIPVCYQVRSREHPGSLHGLILAASGKLNTSVNVWMAQAIVN